MESNEQNKYLLQWQDYYVKAGQAAMDNNFQLHDEMLKKAQEYLEMYKEDTKMTGEDSNFGVWNQTFESVLPELFMRDRKIVREFITTIKEDKNLLNQFKFIKSLENYSKELDAISYINEALSLFHENVDIKTIDKSNAKLKSIIEKYDIKSNELISEDKKSLYKDCDFLFKNKKKMTNLSEVNLRIKSLSESLLNNSVNKVNENKKDSLKLIDEFEMKYGSLLNEEEKDFVKEIMSSKESSNNKKKEKLFNNIKNECLSLINGLINESSDDDMDGLNAIKEQITNKQFCLENLVGDIAKLLEIRDILKDK